MLTLQLDQLSLDLLGLLVDLSKVILTITADPNGGVLGRLFCSVVNTHTLASVSNARTLSSVAQRSRLSTKVSASGCRHVRERRSLPALVRSSICSSARCISSFSG